MKRRCYNTKSGLQKLVADARSRAQSRRNTAARKPTATKDSSDPELITAIAECRACPGYGQFWIKHKLGTLNEFKAALAANSQRIQRLFGDAPIR
jgi:hypothetical protein